MLTSVKSMPVAVTIVVSALALTAAQHASADAGHAQVVAIPTYGVTCQSDKQWTIDVLPTSDNHALVTIFNPAGAEVAANDCRVRLLSHARGVSHYSLTNCWVEMGQTATLSISENVGKMRLKLNFKDVYPSDYPSCLPN